MPQRINVYIPDDLHRALEVHRARLNVSRICQDALAKEVSRLETAQQTDEALPRLDEEERRTVAARLRGERERRRTYWYALGYRTAFEWARQEADPESLSAVAAGEALDADPNPGWAAGRMFDKRPAALAARVWTSLHRQANETAKGNASAPLEDVDAFNGGVRDGAKAVWDLVAADVEQTPDLEETGRSE